MFYQHNHLATPDYLEANRCSELNFPAHLHQCFEIIASITGEMEITIEGTSYTIDDGQAVLVFPNQIHSLTSISGEQLICIFSPQLVQAYTSKTHKKVPKSNHFTLPEHLLDMLLNLQEFASIIEKKGVLYTVCSYFDKETTYYEKQTDSQKLLSKIFSFVEETFKNDCSLKNLSKKTGYDYAYLSRYFAKSVGLSFNSYVTNYRLDHACYLLENTTLPIIDCAYESGFKTLRSFNRQFKETFNLTPTQYRKEKD
jgi:AraC-like DNA-binding protein